MEVQIGERIVDVTLLSKDKNNVNIEIDGKVYSVDVCMLQNGQCSILSDGISYNSFIVHEEGTKNYKVSLNYSTYDISMLDSQAKYMKLRKKGREQEQDDKIKAPMPSKIIKLYVKEGQAVQEGDILITLEAMKMQSNIVAAKDCEVLAVNCKEGDNVMAGQVLISLNINEAKA